MPGADLPAVPAPREQAPAIWIFIALDCSSFGLFFLVFMAERISQSALFDASSRQLHSELGFLNACILITSSWLVAWANVVGRKGDFVQAKKLLVWGLAVAACFGVVKTLEYYKNLVAGITVSSNEFFMLNFLLSPIQEAIKAFQGKFDAESPTEMSWICAALTSAPAKDLQVSVWSSGALEGSGSVATSIWSRRGRR